MPIISLPAIEASVDIRGVLNRIPLQEVMNYHPPLNVLNAVKMQIGSEGVLETFSDEMLCDCLISRGYNIEM